MILEAAAIAISLAAAVAPRVPMQADAPARTADAREIATYRLSVDALAKVTRVTHAMIDELKKDPRVQERIKIASELTALANKDEPTAAEATRIEELQDRMERLGPAQPEALSRPGTLREMEAAIKAYPPLSEPLANEQMTPREYAKFFLALIRASLAASAQRAGVLKELPPDVRHDNVQFVLDHEADLQKIQQEFHALSGGTLPAS